MTATLASKERRRGGIVAPVELVVEGVLNPRSLGVSRYARSLGNALVGEGVEYVLRSRPSRAASVHFHLANSSRALLLERPGRMERAVVTVHDVVPRLRALRPLYRARIYPLLSRRASVVIVHSTFAADLLVREAGARPARLEVVPHPARRPEERDRASARADLGWPEDTLIAVLPGVIKPAKLVREALAAVAGTGWRLALSGRPDDAAAVRSARSLGALVLPDPDDAAYERAIVASDCVLCLRAGSVGETNGPLLDALGAGRAVLATPTGSIPEVAGEAAAYCDGTESEIRRALEGLTSEGVRAELERRAASRAAELTWEASAAHHAHVFREVLDE